MKAQTLIYILLLIADFAYSQNLVPNYSFETNSGCPNDIDQISLASPWFNPTHGSSDYFHTCASYSDIATPSNYFGVQSPRTGFAYAGLFACLHCPSIPGYDGFREYIEVKLNSTLISGQIYYASFYVSLDDYGNYGTDDLGIHFSNDTVKSNVNTNLTFTPQIQNTSGNYLISKTGWMRVSGTYTANGTENFITIGNFKNVANTDTMKVPGGGDPTDFNFAGGYYYVDDVCVSTDSTVCLGLVSVKEFSEQVTYGIFPNPFTDKTTFHFNNVNGGSYSLSIYNIKGILVRRITNIFSNNLIIEKGDLSEGLYYFHLYRDKNIVATGKLSIE